MELLIGPTEPYCIVPFKIGRGGYWEEGMEITQRRSTYFSGRGNPRHTIHIRTVELLNSLL